MMVQNQYSSGLCGEKAPKDIISSQSPSGLLTRRENAERPPEEGLSFDAIQAE